MYSYLGFKLAMVLGGVAIASYFRRRDQRLAYLFLVGAITNMSYFLAALFDTVNGWFNASTIIIGFLVDVGIGLRIKEVRAPNMNLVQRALSQIRSSDD